MTEPPPAPARFGKMLLNTGREKISKAKPGLSGFIVVSSTKPADDVGTVQLMV